MSGRTTPCSEGCRHPECAALREAMVQREATTKEVVELRHHRMVLEDAITDIARAAHAIRADASVRGPDALLIAQDLRNYMQRVWQNVEFAKCDSRACTFRDAAGECLAQAEAADETHRNFLKDNPSILGLASMASDVARLGYLNGQRTAYREMADHLQTASVNLDAPAFVARNARQVEVLDWVRSTFGAACLTGHERAARLLEEALELAQVEGLSLSAVGDLAAHVYGKPVGERAQELGGIGVTLLAYAATVGLSADAEEALELARVRALPPEHFRKRQNVKADAGVAVRVALPPLAIHCDAGPSCQSTPCTCECVGCSAVRAP